MKTPLSFNERHYLKEFAARVEGDYEHAPMVIPPRIREAMVEVLEIKAAGHAVTDLVVSGPRRPKTFLLTQESIDDMCLPGPSPTLPGSPIVETPEMDRDEVWLLGRTLLPPEDEG